MGKFEWEAKQETAGILEAGVAILSVEDWQTRGMLGFLFFGGFLVISLSLWLFFMQLLSLLLIFFRCASIMRSYCVNLLMQLALKVTLRNDESSKGSEP
jgi:hypothetical protein